MGLSANGRLYAPSCFAVACLALAAFAVKAAGEDEADCTRYRIAGLPCPSKAGNPRLPARPLLPLRAAAHRECGIY